MPIRIGKLEECLIILESEPYAGDTGVIVDHQLYGEFPARLDASSGGRSVPAGDVPSDGIVPGGTAADSNATKFPAFTGKDLDGNDVSSDKLFSGNAFTVVNFWFTTCKPCVGELGDLDALHKDVAGKGGAVVGINAFTLGGDAAAIADAKDVLTKSGATYQNVYFDADSEAGKFTENVYAYPTTYVVDRNGNIVGDPIAVSYTHLTLPTSDPV